MVNQCTMRNQDQCNIGLYFICLPSIWLHLHTIQMNTFCQLKLITLLSTHNLTLQAFLIASIPFDTNEMLNRCTATKHYSIQNKEFLASQWACSKNSCGLLISSSSVKFAKRYHFSDKPPTGMASLTKTSTPRGVCTRRRTAWGCGVFVVSATGRATPETVIHPSPEMAMSPVGLCSQNWPTSN